MADDPIRAGQGIYTVSSTKAASGSGKKSGIRKRNIGVCLVIDDDNTWDIKEAKDGSVIVIIPPGSKWKVTMEQLPGAKRKAVIFREGANLKPNGVVSLPNGEFSIEYEELKN